MNRPFFQYCRQGVTRRVLLVGNYAIKVPNAQEWRTFIYGITANMIERKFSEMDEPRLAKIHYANRFGFLLIMERLHPLTDAQWDEFNYKAFCDQTDWHMEGITEDKRDGLGSTPDGQIKFVDYGSNVYKSGVCPRCLHKMG